MIYDRIRVRFAPSPTGMVHIGNIRVALFNWLFARHNQGEFLLRIEDTDKERSTPEAVNAILDSLRWLGLLWDGNLLMQSSQTKEHMNAVDMLLSNGDAYKDETNGTVKFRIPNGNLGKFPEINDGCLEYDDIVKGRMSKRLEDMEDFVIVRSDGSPVFHIANVVDDITQDVTHVIRGDDHVENTFKHILLFRCLGKTPPRYAHLPMIVNAQGKPYSKRDGDAYVGDFKDKGILPSVLLNSLALTGWSPADGRERMTRDELVEAFTLERCHRSPAMLDMKKMLSMNGKAIAEMDEDTFHDTAVQFMKSHDEIKFKDDSHFRKVCRLMQTRTKTLSDIGSWAYFFSDAGNGEGLDEYKDAFQRFVKKTDGIHFTVDALRQATEEVETELGLKKGSINQPLRMVVTGVKTGCGIHETMEAIGREETIRRIERAISKMEDNHD